MIHIYIQRHIHIFINLKNQSNAMHTYRQIHTEHDIHTYIQTHTSNTHRDIQTDATYTYNT